MSFILDQLKKSGIKRQLELAMRRKAGIESREPVGASQTDVQPTSRPMHNKRVIYLLLFLAVVSFSALGAFFLLRGNPGNRQATIVSTKAPVYTAEPSELKTKSAKPESLVPVDGGTFLPIQSYPAASPEKEVPAPAVVREKPEGKVKSSMSIPTDELQNQPDSTSQAQIAHPSPPEKSEMQEDAPSIPYLNELPASLKNALPPIRMTSHLYRGDSRLVSINGRIMSGGVNMGEGLMLEEITPEGVIMSFRGQRFRLKAD
jgi:general secretion pathway protein B